jgi:alkaline phosphatase D
MREVRRGYHMSRRHLLAGLGSAFATGCRDGVAPVRDGRLDSGASRATGRGAELRWGVQSGDVTATSGVVWSRADRPARFIVEWSTDARLQNAQRIVGPMATEASDFTARLALTNLAPGRRIHYRAGFESEGRIAWSEGSFSTAPDVDDRRDVVFAWSGDSNGQGWGIDDKRGGMPAYAALLDRAPDFFIHCGDRIYADDPIQPSIAIPDGTTWNSLVFANKDHKAETLEDFRGAFLYSRASAQVRALSASVPLFAIWDDHEVRNNWWPGQSPDIDRIAAHARQAMYEHTPTLVGPRAEQYRSIRWGPHLEVFLLDGRTHRTRNHPLPPPSGPSRFLGDAQLTWLARALVDSTATWKVIASDMPVGLVVSEPDGAGGESFDGFANVDGPPRDRELELVELFATLRKHHVKNVVWLTADVHYAAAHHYDPARAAHRDFDPFWEFVAGPMHATAFPRKRFDDTFGPELAYASAENDTFGSPATGEQFFGVIRIDGSSRSMKVTLIDARGRDLHTTTIRPA